MSAIYICNSQLCSKDYLGYINLRLNFLQMNCDLKIDFVGIFLRITQVGGCIYLQIEIIRLRTLVFLS